MRKNKSRKQIYNEIRQEMPADLNEKEMAAFIMKKIAEQRSFSSKYYWSDNKTREKIYKSCVKKDSKRMQNKRQLICVTATKMYKYLAEKFGLDCYVIGDTELTKDDFSIFKTGEHISPVIKTKDGQYIKVDVEWDLENIQTGRRWTKFGTKDGGQDKLTELSEKERDNIMKKIGYIVSKKDYLENYLESSYLADSNIPIEEKISKLFSDEEINKKVSNLKSSVDIYRFYRRIIKEYITKDEEIALYGGCSKNKIKNRNKYTILANLKGNDEDKFWIWSNRKKQMANISKTSIKQFIDKGFVKLVPGKNGKRYERMIERMNNEKTSSHVNDVPVNEIWSR